jgi:phosphate-selective porin OprO and OprP
MRLLKSLLSGVGLCICLGGLTARAEDANTLQIIQQLKQRIDELERKVQTLEDSASTAPTRSNAVVDATAETIARTNLPTISLGERGFSFASANSNYVLRLGAVLQLDTRTFFNDPGDRGNNGFLLRRVRPYLSGTVLRDFDFYFVPDFGTSGNGGNNGITSTPQIYDASLTYRYSRALQFTAGKFKAPVGLELLQADRDTTFNERSLASDLVPSRDLGFEMHGDLFDDTVSYAVGIFNGVGDARVSSNSNVSNDKSFAGRLFVHPLRPLALDPLKGFGFGLGGSFEDIQGTNTASLPNTTGGSNPGYATVGQQQFFAYTNGVVAAGQHWRLSPQGSYYYGPFGFLGEYVISDQKVRTAKSGPMHLDHTAWQLTASWVLTGEDANYDGGVVPRFDFNPAEGGWGAWQLAARYSELNIDGAAFPKFADPRASARSAREWALGLNWYLSRNIRADASFSHTEFNGGGQSPSSSAPAITTRRDENVLFTRLQLAF